MDHHFKQEKSSLPKGTPGTENATVEVKAFQPRTFVGNVAHSSSVPASPETKFNLHPAAKKSLGIENEESRHLETRIAEEVEKRLVAIGEQARAEGFEQGRADGEAQAFSEFTAKTQPLYDQFSEIVNHFEASKEEIYRANEEFLVQLVFQVAKQVTLKEVKADPAYVKNLCNTLVEKIGAKDHVKIRISREDFAQVDSIREHLKQSFPELKNIQIDAADGLTSGGCKVETDLARIDASVDTQLQLIHQALGEK